MYKQAFVRVYQTLMKFVGDDHPVARRMQAAGFRRGRFTERYQAQTYHDHYRLVGIFRAPVAASPGLFMVVDIYSDLYQADLWETHHEPQWVLSVSFADTKIRRGLYGTRNVSKPFTLEFLQVKLFELVQAPVTTASLLHRVQGQVMKETAAAEDAS